MEGSNPIPVKKNKNVGVEKNKINKYRPQEYKAKINFFTILIFPEKELRHKKVYQVKQQTAYQ